MSNSSNEKKNKNKLILDSENNPFDAYAVEEGKNDNFFTEKGSKIFVNVPKNTYLVKVNRFTGNITFNKKAGINLTCPLIHQIYFVTAKEVTKDYEVEKNIRTKDNIEIACDFSLNVVISDPSVYKVVSANPMEKLRLLIIEKVGRYVAQTDFDDLKDATFDLDAIIPLIDRLNFERDTGVRILGGNFKQPRVLGDAKERLNDVALAKIMLKEEKEKLKIADLQGKNRGIMVVSMINEQVAVMKKYGMSDKEIREKVKELIIILNSKYSISGVGSLKDSSGIVGSILGADKIAESILAGTVGSKDVYDKSSVFSYLDDCQRNGKLNPKQVEDIKKKIDKESNLTSDTYKQLLEYLKKNTGDASSMDDNPSKGGRSKK